MTGPINPNVVSILVPRSVVDRLSGPTGLAKLEGRLRYRVRELAYSRWGAGVQLEFATITEYDAEGAPTGLRFQALKIR